MNVVIQRSSLRRCLWCHGNSGLVEVELSWREPLTGSVTSEKATVHPEHEALVRLWEKRVSRWGTAWLIAIITLIGSSPYLGFSLGWTFAAFPVVVVGVLVAALPFPTPQTIDGFGLRGSTRLARGLGFGLIGVGVVIFTLLR